MTIGKKKTFIFIPGTIGFLLITFLGLHGYLKTEKKKNELDKAAGIIVLIASKYEYSPFDYRHNMRYIKVTGNDRVFAFYAGEDSAMAKSYLAKLDSLHIGDTIKIYYEDWSKDELTINSHAVYIDKNDKPYFDDEDTGGKYVMMGMFCFGLISITVLTLLKKKDIII